MSRHPIEPYNDEFNALLERVIGQLGGGKRRPFVGQAMQEAADALGVTVHAVKSWVKPLGGNSSCYCPKWRFDMYRLAVDPKLSGLSDSARATLLENLNALRRVRVMNESSARAFEKIAKQKHNQI
jgi:hypothetical protein